MIRKKKIGVKERTHFLLMLTNLAMQLESKGYCCFLNWYGHVEKVSFVISEGKDNDKWQHDVFKFENYLCGEVDDYQEKYWRFLEKVEPLLEEKRIVQNEYS